MELLTIAALELNRTDNQQVVKVAGIVRRLRNWYRKLTDPEYRAKVMQLQADSVRVKSDIDELEKQITDVHKSIKDSDVESYNFAVDRVRAISQRLVKELDKYESSAQAADPDPKNQFTEEYPTLPASLERTESVHISNNVRDAVWNIRSVKAALERHNMPEAQVEAFVNDSARLNAFYDALAQAVKQGQIVSSWESPKSKLDINRNGELQYRVVTPSFVIPGTSFNIQVTVEGTDLSARKRSPRPVFSVHKFNFIDARQKSADKMRDYLNKAKLQLRIEKSLAKLSHKIEKGA